MSNTALVPLFCVLTAYYAYYWTGLTSVMVHEARHDRMKRHLDWTVERRRGSTKSVWKLW
jgi:hypothetical protein